MKSPKEYLSVLHGFKRLGRFIPPLFAGHFIYPIAKVLSLATRVQGSADFPEDFSFCSLSPHAHRDVLLKQSLVSEDMPNLAETAMK